MSNYTVLMTVPDAAPASEALGTQAGPDRGFAPA